MNIRLRSDRSLLQGIQSCFSCFRSVHKALSGSKGMKSFRKRGHKMKYVFASGTLPLSRDHTDLRIRDDEEDLVVRERRMRRISRLA